MPPRVKYSVGDARGLPVLADALGARQQLLVGVPGRRDAGEVALDVGGEDRNAVADELLGEHLQRAGLAGSGGAGDEAVPVDHGERDADLHVGQRVAVHERADLEGAAVEGVAGVDGVDCGWRRAGRRCLSRGP